MTNTRTTSKTKTVDNKDICDSREGLSLWVHQEEAVEFMRKHKNVLLQMDVGTGKTGATLVYISELLADPNRATRIVILAPLITLENWYREAKNFIPKYAHYFVLLNDKLNAKRIKRMDGFRGAQHPVVFIANHESLRSQVGAAFENMEPDLLVVDEIHRFKNPQAKQSQKAYALASASHQRIGLTGTPILKDERDIWGQFRIINSELLGKNFFVFRNRYMYNANADKPWLTFADYQLIPSKRHEIAKITAKHIFQRSKSEVMKYLPPLLRKPVYLPLAEEAENIYKAMEKDFVATLPGEGGTLDSASARIALTKMLRLQQICCGFVTTESGEERAIGTRKYIALLDIVNSIIEREKIIIWTSFRRCVKHIATLLDDAGIQSVKITGDQLSNKRQEAIDAFQTKENVRVCIANPAAGGIGISLTAASTMIYFNKNYNLEHDLQSEARAHRGGSERHEVITRLDLITMGTVEEEIDLALRDKKDIGDLFTALRQRVVSC